MIRFIQLVALAALSLGCSTNYVRGPATQASLKAIQARHPGVPIWIEPLAQSGGESGTAFPLVGTTPELTFVVATPTSQPEYSLPTRRVGRVHVYERGTGAAYGAVIGALISAGLIAAYWVTYTPCEDCVVHLGREGSTVLIGLPVSVVVIGLSSLFGALVPVETEYVFK